MARFGGFHSRLIALCFLIAAVDGFDTQCISFVAPTLLQEWGLSRAAFGPLFSAGLFGTMLGAMTLGPAADRFGRPRCRSASPGGRRPGAVEMEQPYRELRGRPQAPRPRTPGLPRRSGGNGAEPGRAGPGWLPGRTRFLSATASAATITGFRVSSTKFGYRRQRWSTAGRHSSGSRTAAFSFVENPGRRRGFA